MLWCLGVQRRRHEEGSATGGVAHAISGVRRRCVGGGTESRRRKWVTAYCDTGKTVIRMGKREEKECAATGLLKRRKDRRAGKVDFEWMEANRCK